jgi:hypothetical protein
LDQRVELIEFFINGHRLSNLSVVKLVVPESWVDGIPHDRLMIILISHGLLGLTAKDMREEWCREVKLMGGRRNMILCPI